MRLPDLPRDVLQLVVRRLPPRGRAGSMAALLLAFPRDRKVLGDLAREHKQRLQDLQDDVDLWVKPLADKLRAAVRSVARRVYATIADRRSEWTPVTSPSFSHTWQQTTGGVGGTATTWHFDLDRDLLEQQMENHHYNVYCVVAQWDVCVGNDVVARVRCTLKTDDMFDENDDFIEDFNITVDSLFVFETDLGYIVYDLDFVPEQGTVAYWDGTPPPCVRVLTIAVDLAASAMW